MTKIQIVKIANSLEMYCPAPPAPIFGVRDCFFLICPGDSFGGIYLSFVRRTPLELLVIFQWMPLAGIYAKKATI